VTAKTPSEEPRPDRLVGVEARKLYAVKLEDGFIAKYLSGSAVLDIGYRGYEPDVVPIVPQAIGIDLDYPGYDGKTLPFADNSQDAVFSSHCLEHAEDCEAAIKEWFRVLKTGGYLVLAVPHKYLYERRHRPPSRWNVDHRRFFTPATLLLRVENALEPNSYRVRQLIDNDFAFGYAIPPNSHPGGCYEIELVVQKITQPSWQLENPALLERRALVAPLLSPSPTIVDEAAHKGRIIYDGLNLALSKGTGIATYTKILAETSRGLGYDVGVVYETPFSIPKDPRLQDILFFDQATVRRRPPREPFSQKLGEALAEHFRRYRSVKSVPVSLGSTVDTRQFTDKLPEGHRPFAAKNVFKAAERYFNDTGRLLRVRFDKAPNIFHCTYALPLKVEKVCNVTTIHDLVPLRLPYATVDDKRAIYNRLKVIAAEADHLVTVSEASKRDIIELLGVPESRITNTYQAVTFPHEYLCRPEEMIADYLAGLYGLDLQGYLLFFGALEPKKNVARLIDAYLSSGVQIPLVLVIGEGWQNEEELARLQAHQSRGGANDKGPTILRLDYTTRSSLVNLIRGARAVVFPSLMEGFGLPVIESMTLGTPVLTSSSGALAEVAGDAALLVDPYDIDAIARGITVLANDSDLCGELGQRGLVQADKFSLSRYQERIGSLYAALIS
jgi:glycosyltransferase involved in cell wall biosynthesis/SAM-dependent methyltransferase